MRHDGDGYFARVEELPGCMTWTDTIEELWPMVEDAKSGWIEDALESGDEVPEPPAEDYSGRVLLRMLKSLHRDLVQQAKREDVSLNQFVTTSLARATGK